MKKAKRQGKRARQQGIVRIHGGLVTDQHCALLDATGLDTSDQRLNVLGAELFGQLMEMGKQGLIRHGADAQVTRSILRSGKPDHASTVFG